jgi:hypothetical protein
MHVDIFARIYRISCQINIVSIVGEHADDYLFS